MKGILQGPMNSIILASVCTMLCQDPRRGVGARKYCPAFQINKKTHKHRQDLGWPGTSQELEGGPRPAVWANLREGPGRQTLRGGAGGRGWGRNHPLVTG